MTLISREAPGRMITSFEPKNHTHSKSNESNGNAVMPKYKDAEFQAGLTKSSLTSDCTPFSIDELNRHSIFSQGPIPHLRRMLPDANSSGGLNYRDIQVTMAGITSKMGAKTETFMKFEGVFAKDLNVPGYQQTTDISCGPSTVMSLLAYDKKLPLSRMNSLTEHQIMSDLKTQPISAKVPGTSPHAIVEYLNRNGYQAELKTDLSMDTIKAELAKGRPIIHLNGDWGAHYKLITGLVVDEINPNPKDTIICVDPAAQWCTTNPKEKNHTTAGAWFEVFSSQEYGYLSPDTLSKGVFITTAVK